MKIQPTDIVQTNDHRILYSIGNPDGYPFIRGSATKPVRSYWQYGQTPVKADKQADRGNL